MPNRSKSPTSSLPAPVAGVPAYRRKVVRGRVYAVVTFAHRDTYLGEYGTTESFTKYNEHVARWLASDRKAEEQQAAALSVNELLLRYVEHAEKKYAARRGFARIMSRIKQPIRTVRELYGTTPAAAFGPKALLLIREKWIRSGRSRKTINEYVKVIKACMQWACAEEVVPGSTWHAISAVKGLRRGEAEVPEPRKVKPVPDAQIDAVMPHLLPQVQAILQLQRLTGMRSGEVCIIRGIDLDMTGKLWIYRPRYHKADHHDLERDVYLGPAAQAVLKPWLRLNTEEYLLRPDEAVAKMRRIRHERRKTPLHQGNAPGTNRSRRPRRRPADRYTPDAYRRAIERACDTVDRVERKRAGQPPCTACSGRGWVKVEHRRRPCKACARAGYIGDRLFPRWHPHRVRHTYATKVRQAHGIEAARILLGHQSVEITAVYAERDQAIARSIAAKIG